MPRSRSRSIASSNCSSISRCATVRVTSSRRSESVVLPWSMCAMMQKFRIFVAARSPEGRSWGASATSVEAVLVLYAGYPVQHGSHEQDNDEKRQIEPAEGRNDSPHRYQHGLDDAGDVVGPATLQARHPRGDRVHQHQHPEQTQHPLEQYPGIAGERSHGQCKLARTCSGMPFKYGAGSMSFPSSMIW